MRAVIDTNVLIAGILWRGPPHALLEHVRAGTVSLNSSSRSSAHIAQARKDHGMTQQELAEQLGVAQQTLAHYEVGRARMPASMLPTVARPLTLSLDELMGQPVPRAARAARGGKREPASRLERQIQAVAQLPKTKRQFVSQMLDTVLSEVSR